MAAAILELAADPSRRRRLGEVARQLAVEHLDRETIIARYEQRLTRLVAARPARVRPPLGRAGGIARTVDRFTTTRAPAPMRRG
jgi:hypothetical protein